MENLSKSGAVEASQDISVSKLITTDKNPRGIPSALFIENIEEFLKQENSSVESALGALNELYSKYKYMENSFEKSKTVYKAKIPEIVQTLEMIQMLKDKQEEDEDFIVNYSLCDTIFSKAKVDKDCGVVCLWIGADTMVEYTYDEAIDLLQKQREHSILKIDELNEDLNFLRGNSITVEVNMARLFNHNVKLKKVKTDQNSFDGQFISCKKRLSFCLIDHKAVLLNKTKPKISTKTEASPIS